MAKKKNEVIGLTCSICKSRNYVTTRNKTNLETKSAGQVTKISLKKFCKVCKKRTLHKETQKLK